MGLHVRTITPYALPGVLALLACWWFFSRKKDKCSTKPDQIPACVDKVETDDVVEENCSSSGAKLVPMDKEEETVLEDGTCSLSLGAQEPLYIIQSCCRVEDDLVKESHLQTVKVGIPQEFADQEVVESKSPDRFRANEVAEIQEVGVCTSSVLSQLLDGNKAAKLNSDTVLNDVEKVCPISTEPCECSQAESIVPTCHDQNQIQEITCDALNQQSDDVCDLGSGKPRSHSEDITQSDITSDVFVKDLDIQPSVALTQLDDAGSHVVQCCQSIHDEIGLEYKGNVALCVTQTLESVLSEQVTQNNTLDLTTKIPLEAKAILQGVESVTAGEPSESCETSSITEVVREANCTNLMDAFSKCLERNEEFENLCPIVDGLKETNTKTFLGGYEAKIVEQLAINIISKVIVAARQEILSSSVNDVSDSSCQVLDENRDVRTCDAQSKQLVQGSDEDSVSANLTLGLIDFDTTCESGLSQSKNLGNTELTSNDFCLEHQREEKPTPNTSVYQRSSKSDFSPFHRTDFFSECQNALEDSSLSVCTSEEGINMDDPLQSTVLSTLSIGYDSLSSSGIELSRETFVSIDKPKKVTCGENEGLYSNGDIKRGSPDINSEGPLTAESEADHSGGYLCKLDLDCMCDLVTPTLHGRHSFEFFTGCIPFKVAMGGSDVNSMDSVDSGCALGNSEQFQNMKQKSDAKKADVVIWEFEVPKYLVGRLIGKQGRFVSFLKQSSGAKIYISTVPYTQDIQICHLEGSQQQIDRALSLIRKKFKDLNLTNIFAPPPPLIPLPVASWLTLPNNVSVEVVVVNVVNAGHMFVQQRTHPTFHALCGLDQHMSLCYSQPGVPTLPTPAEVGILCAAPVGPSVWWRAQVMAYFEDTEEVEILYVDYGGYNRVKIETLRQIRSDFVSLPFQGVEVLLDNVIPLGDEDHFSTEADAAVKELTRGAPMLTQVTNYDEATRLPLVQLWRLNPDEMVSVNRTLVERGFAEWVDNY
ncbi:A-kinase anchor protein 1, mitochondrial [Aquarana catesbeiana]|uniref:A-kinase anchor protein 1, mitochondrial n=1 Tax=Aquarana catesbeiana TaxID=8400 RepID=UPI003CC9D89A